MLTGVRIVKSAGDVEGVMEGVGSLCCISPKSGGDVGGVIEGVCLLGCISPPTPLLSPPMNMIAAIPPKTRENNPTRM